MIFINYIIYTINILYNENNKYIIYLSNIAPSINKQNILKTIFIRLLDHYEYCVYNIVLYISYHL